MDNQGHGAGLGLGEVLRQAHDSAAVAPSQCSGIVVRVFATLREFNCLCIYRDCDHYPPVPGACSPGGEGQVGDGSEEVHAVPHRAAVDRRLYRVAVLVLPAQLGRGLALAHALQNYLKMLKIDSCIMMIM